mmetsp:Transcript_46534/g.75952  ORF Transcript_46534/g.75952 Transcript_46534/m.75952 type:complete len:222 (+) Transcript_46534:1226-1891(+)
MVANSLYIGFQGRTFGSVSIPPSGWECISTQSMMFFGLVLPWISFRRSLNPKPAAVPTSVTDGEGGLSRQWLWTLFAYFSGQTIVQLDALEDLLHYNDWVPLPAAPPDFDWANVLEEEGTARAMVGSVMAGVCEELVFRSCLFSVFSCVMPRPLAAIGASLVFGWVHSMYSGARRILVSLLGLTYTAIYLATKDLAPCMYAHVLHDLCFAIPWVFDLTGGP